MIIYTPYISSPPALFPTLYASPVLLLLTHLSCFHILHSSLPTVASHLLYNHRQSSLSTCHTPCICYCFLHRTSCIA
ncbi:hypothetical protein B0J11DRAFT_302342 [Dendryphion nanum]|uniref:Uncharacterized protein n=1 Tax=Dendryphion nanum TaxID=256645 RepID=A0A9P9DUM0_9PLEO|nr:hypothetical protein B0J11DRAFT_302342 [Dendryphion nanum]